MKDINLLITIIKRMDSDELISLFQQSGVSIMYSATCNGTARKKTLDILGMEHTEKAVFFSIMPRQAVKSTMEDLSTDFYIDAPDRGIAIAIPLNGMGGKTALNYFMQGYDDIEVEEKEMPTEYELIITIADSGNTDLVMDAAREAGAGGGTVIHAKGTASRNAEKFFGVSIADEKEMIFIVATNENKKDIMRAIMQKAGTGTDAHAVVFSMPISETAGFRNIKKKEEGTAAV